MLSKLGAKASLFVDWIGLGPQGLVSVFENISNSNINITSN